MWEGSGEEPEAKVREPGKGVRGRGRAAARSLKPR